MKYLVEKNELYTSFNKDLVFVAGSNRDAVIIAYLLNNGIIKEGDLMDAIMSIQAMIMAGGE